MRLISLCLILTLITGCAATRQVHFDSYPAGARVQFAGATCTTPCYLPAAADDGQLAQISLADRRTRIVQVKGGASAVTRVGRNVSSATGKTLGYVAIPLLAVGGFGLILFSGDETDSFYNRDYQYDRGLFYVTIGALVSGAMLMWAAKGMKDISSDLETQEEVHVSFDDREEKRASAYKPTLTIDELTRPAKISPVTGH